MYEFTYGKYNLNPPNWLQVLAYLALPILLFGLGVVWPILHPPAQSAAANQHRRHYYRQHTLMPTLSREVV